MNKFIYNQFSDFTYELERDEKLYILLSDKNFHEFNYTDLSKQSTWYKERKIVMVYE